VISSIRVAAEFPADFTRLAAWPPKLLSSSSPTLRNEIEMVHNKVITLEKRSNSWWGRNCF